jgi:hypothetical protein
MKRGWLALLLIACAACAAQRETERALLRQEPGKVLFESYTVEQTWGYKLSGMYIESDGTVWVYEHTGTPWYPEKLKPDELSERDMLIKHKNARQIGKVDPTQLTDMTALFKPAARGKVTRVSGPGTGDGTVEVAYLLDRKASTYHEIVLAGQGDRVASNSAPEAQLLLDYFHNVQRLMAQTPAPNP